MGIITKKCIVFALVLIITGCVYPTGRGSARIHILWDNYPHVEHCTYLGTVSGSFGHWYNFWFYTNDHLLSVAIDTLRAQAEMRGADTLYLYSPFNFTSSVTLLANAYRCQQASLNSVKTDRAITDTVEQTQ